MKVQRTLPPAAALLRPADLLHGAGGILAPGWYQEKLERGLKEYFGVSHVFVVSSGKAAFHLILRALTTLSPGKQEVLVPAYTCYSVPSAIVKAGLRVTACDIDPATFDFDQRQLDRAVTDRTLCIVPNNLFGIPSDLDRIRAVAAARRCFVVEDAAQAMGVTAAGRKAGARGDAGFFSLGRGKNITCGSGGIIVTNNDRIAEAVAREHRTLKRPSRTRQAGELVKAMLLALFIRPGFFWLPAGLPFLKLGETFFHSDFPVLAGSGVQAGLLRHWQERLESSNRERSGNASALAQTLGMSGFLEANAPCLRLPLLAADRQARDRIAAAAREAGLGISRLYPGPISTITELAETFAGRSFPSAEQVAERLLTLPTHHFVTPADRRRIAELLGMDRG